MPNLSESDLTFIRENLPEDLVKKIESAQTVNEILDVLNFWINRCDACWELNGEDYSDFGRAAQRVYDNIYLYA